MTSNSIIIGPTNQMMKGYQSYIFCNKMVRLSLPPCVLLFYPMECEEQIVGRLGKSHLACLNINVSGPDAWGGRQHRAEQEDYNKHFKKDGQKQVDNWCYNHSTGYRHCCDLVFQIGQVTETIFVKCVSSLFVCLFFFFWNTMSSLFLRQWEFELPSFSFILF